MKEDASVAAGNTTTAAVAGAAAPAGLLLEHLLPRLDCCHLLVYSWLLHCHHLVWLRLLGGPQPI